jgi:hypothetical protein
MSGSLGIRKYDGIRIGVTPRSSLSDYEKKKKEKDKQATGTISCRQPDNTSTTLKGKRHKIK